jgi:hypothetical protein
MTVQLVMAMQLAMAVASKPVQFVMAIASETVREV